MFSWTEPMMNKAKQDIQDMISQSTGVSPELEVNNHMDTNNPFKLPITYLPETELFPLSSVVSSDLELVESKSTKSMYDHLFQPSTPFASKMVHEWKKQYTTNIQYLHDTQQILLEQVLPERSVTVYSPNHDSLMEIWKDTKEDSDFLEKYCFVEWEILKSLNRSPGFLQILSMANILSPAISLVIPILFLVFPFIILKIRGIPITFSVYLDVLKDIAKHHFIGKTLIGLATISWDKAIYLVITLGLYLYQIYQNVLVCTRFYRNIQKINSSLYEMKQYLGHSIENMENFIQNHQSKKTYQSFCQTVQEHCSVLQRFRDELEPIAETQNSIITKLSEVGYLLKCYYELHSNKTYEISIQYSFGFEGFLDNLRGVAGHLRLGKVSLANFDISKACTFKDQYYPPLMDEIPVKNSCSLKRKIIITGPNASGKTTLLKTTTLNIIFTQQMGCGFYSACVLNPYTHIHSYLNIPDTSERDSLFQAESRRCKEILDLIRDNPTEKGFRHYCIFDELYSGTNPLEATKSAYAFLNYLTKFNHVDFILTTHYVSICSKLKKSKQISNYKMEVETDENGLMVYTYKMKKGISKVQGAIRILEDMNYPSEIIQSVKSF